MPNLTLPAAGTSARILVTNDDGIHAEGLQALNETMLALSDDVWVIAPETEQSGAGHSLTIHQPLRARQLGPKRYAISGTPTDCVLLGVKEILPDDAPVSLVVSGINHGDNVAENITYSGTIAATMEATLLGIPAIAFSRAITDDGELTWHSTQTGVQRVMEALQGFTLAPSTLLSVNIPDCPVEALAPPAAARQGQRWIHDDVETRIDPRGRTYYWIGGSNNGGSPPAAQTDCALLDNRHITVTPLSLDLTHRDMMEPLKQQLARARHVSA